MEWGAGRRRRRGQVIVVMTACLPLLCVIAAATIDVGNLCTTKAQLQNAADAGAVAAVRELWKSRADGWDESAARAYAAAEAETIADLNHGGVHTQVQCGTWDEEVFQEGAFGVCVNAVRVTVFRSEAAAAGPVETFFACVFGLNEVEQHAVAVARFRPLGIAPFSIYEPDVVAPGQSLTLYDDDQVTPGVFGLLDLDGEANSADDLIEWVMAGYQGLLWIDPEVGYIDIEGNPGWVDALSKPVDDKIESGEPVIACVYSNVWGGAAHTVFRVVGFVAVIVTEQGREKVDGEQRKYIRATVCSKYVPGNMDTLGEIMGFMRLQLVQ